LMHGRCHVWSWLIELCDVVPSCVLHPFPRLLSYEYHPFRNNRKQAYKQQQQQKKKKKKQQQPQTNKQNKNRMKCLSRCSRQVFIYCDSLSHSRIRESTSSFRNNALVVHFELGKDWLCAFPPTAKLRNSTLAIWPRGRRKRSCLPSLLLDHLCGTCVARVNVLCYTQYLFYSPDSPFWFSPIHFLPILGKVMCSPENRTSSDEDICL